MRISFSNEDAARTAVAILQHYGYQATPQGAAVETECPALLAVPAVGNAVGLHQIEKVHIAGPPRGSHSQCAPAQA